MKTFILKVFACSVIAASSLTAGDWYIGASVGASSVKSDTISDNGTTGASSSTSMSKTVNGIGVKAGYKIDGSNSIELEYISIASNMTGIRVNYVYKHSIGEIRPFIGGGIGFVKYNEDFDMGGNEHKFDKNAPAWNVKAGLVYQIAKQHEFEFGYDYMSLGNMSQNYTIATQAVSVQHDNVRVGRLYAAYNFRF